MKDPSPRSVSVLAALSVSLLVCSFLFLTEYFTGVGFPWWMYPAIFVGSFLLGFLIVFFLIRRFIQSKIRLIHRTVHDLKTQQGKDDLEMDRDVLGEINEEVRSWAEDQSEEIQRLKEQEAFRRQFIGNLAHELKTPVFSIQGYILTLLEGAVDDPEINRKFLDRASKGVDRMTHIIEDLDTITRFESGRMELEQKEFDVRKVVRNVMETLELKASKKKISLGFREPSGKAVKVIGDQGRIEQVFTNLLSNSINYGREEGKTEVGFFDMDEQVLIEVSDNGIGISEDDVPRLFERFYRADKSRSRNGGGTGLGLAIVKHILDAHGQTIDVRSREGEGSTFSFTLKKA